jgi:beta-glucosidase
MGLGGATNLAREPRCGRLFEYLGEDPVLSGELLAQRTLGTQSEKIIASIKHFAGNEQETNRLGGNSVIDVRGGHGAGSDMVQPRNRALRPRQSRHLRGTD